MIYSFGEWEPISPLLYAVAFDEAEAEAFATVDALRTAGAIPLALADGRHTVSQGFGIPLTVKGCQVLYLYALATDPASRGQGHLRTLLEETKNRATANGYAALCLLPANSALADAYRRMGFSAEQPAGGDANAATGDSLSFTLTDRQATAPIDAPECRALFGGALTPALFDYTLSTLPKLRAVRIGTGAALILGTDARRALAVSPGAEPLYRRTADHCLLVMPLCGSVPPIPEPLPR